jgi:hypothetical protein
VREDHGLPAHAIEPDNGGVNDGNGLPQMIVFPLRAMDA